MKWKTEDKSNSTKTLKGEARNYFSLLQQKKNVKNISNVNAFVLSFSYGESRKRGEKGFRVKMFVSRKFLGKIREILMEIDKKLG